MRYLKRLPKRQTYGQFQLHMATRLAANEHPGLVKLQPGDISTCVRHSRQDQEKTGGCAECAYEQTFLPHPFPARMSELLEAVPKQPEARMSDLIYFNPMIRHRHRLWPSIL